MFGTKRKRVTTPMAIAAGLAIGFAVVCCPGCRTAPEREETPAHTPPERTIDQVALYLDLKQFANNAYADVVGTTGTIAANTQDRVVREHALRWKIGAADSMAQFMREPDPRHAFVLAWTTIVEQRHGLTEGGRRQIFADQQKLAVDLVNRLERAIETLGRRHFTKEEMDEAEAEVDALNAIAPPEGEAAAEASPAEGIVEFAGRGVGAILSVPLSPFTGLKGVADTPAAIGEFANVAGNFAEIVRRLPERIRWEMELLLLELESLETVVTARADLDRFANGVESVAETARTLPGDIRSELEGLLDTLEEAQPRLQATLTAAKGTVVEARATVAELAGAMDKAGQLTASVRAAVEDVSKAAAAWESTARVARDIAATVSKPDEPEGVDEGPAIEQWTELAEKANAILAEARALRADLDRPLDEASGINQVGALTQGLIDGLAWRAAQLIALVFVAALAYRAIVTLIWGAKPSAKADKPAPED